MGDLLFQEIQDALCREGKLLPDFGVATFQLLAETTLGPAAYHLTDGFTTGSVSTFTAGIEEGELLWELGEEQGVIQLSFVTAKFHLVIRPQIQQTVEKNVLINLTRSKLGFD